MLNFSTLSNGITVASDYISEVPSVSISINVKVGSRYEDTLTNGISHFIEHMAFKGTEKRTAKQIATDFENIGASFNAYTSKETTVYYGRVLKEKSEELFEILADIVQNSTFDENELEKERGVILQEIAMTNDDPDDIIDDFYKETAFTNQPYGRSVLGPTENIKRFKRNDLVDYVSKYYIADNIYVVASGNIKQKDLENWTKKYLSKIKSGKKNDFEKAEYNGGYLVKNKDLEQTHCILGFKGLSYKDKDIYKLFILNSIIGGGMSSRLFQEVRENKGLCYTIYSTNVPTYETGSFEIYTATDPNKINDALEAIIVELKKLFKEEITDEELNRAKIKAKSSILMQMESTSYRGAFLANGLIFRNKMPSVDEISKEIDNTTIQDLKRILKDILITKPTLVIYGNSKNVIKYDKILEEFSSIK